MPEYLATPPPSWAKWQRVINNRPPAQPTRVPLQPQPIEVLARVVWATDGEEWVPGLAVRWTREVVFVELRDERAETLGAWLVAGDVRRR